MNQKNYLMESGYFLGRRLSFVLGAVKRETWYVYPLQIRHTQKSQVFYFVILGKTELDLLRSESDFSFGVFMTSNEPL